ncbi:MAG: hypothetical protein HQM08_28295 [Candidatus Riflebacteria bacterium]|nr:hypothetical protein [Candidatus Riflebacteria bacterium]
MRVGSTIQPWTDGAKKYSRKYGDSLVCVRFRYDEKLKKRFTTVELIVDEAPWFLQKRAPTDQKTPKMVKIKIEKWEKQLRADVKSAGGKWLPEEKLWSLPLPQVLKLDLESRIVNEEGNRGSTSGIFIDL